MKQQLLDAIEEQTKRVEKLKAELKTLNGEDFKTFTEAVLREKSLKEKLNIESAYLEGLEDALKELKKEG